MQKLNGSASSNFVATQKERKPPARDKLGRILRVEGVEHTEVAYQAIYGKDRESPEQRAFRRFPIDRHKSGGW